MSAPLLTVEREGESLRVRTPAKLNLFLEIEGRRPDGYHDIVSLMLALDWGDTLIVRERSHGSDDTLKVKGESAPEDDTNLVWRALRLARETRTIPPLEMHLRKSIPAGAGLGGGSGNAAGMLMLLESIAPDPRGTEGRRLLAARLGSDVPFFLSSSAAMVARGRGERLEPCTGTLFGGDRPEFVLVIPALPFVTARAYRSVPFPLTSPDGPISFPARTFEIAGEWQRGLFNRLEGPVQREEPRLAKLARALREPRLDVLATAAMMTGSGSTFFLVGPDPVALEAALLASDGPLENFTTSTGVPVVTRRVRPHPVLFDAAMGGIPADDAARRTALRGVSVEITEVRVKLVEGGQDKLRAFCSITIDDAFVVRDLKIIEGNKGLFVAMPSRKLTSRCTRCGFKNPVRSNYCCDCGVSLPAEATQRVDGRGKIHADIAHPIHSECREQLQSRVVEAYLEEVDASQVPGYAPREIDEPLDPDPASEFSPEPAVPYAEELEKTPVLADGVPEAAVRGPVTSSPELSAPPPPETARRTHSEPREEAPSRRPTGRERGPLSEMPPPDDNFSAGIF